MARSSFNHSKRIVVAGVLAWSALLPVVFAQPPDVRWQRAAGGAGADVATAVAATRDGRVIVAGYSRSADGEVTMHHGTPERTDYWIAAFDADGVLQWQRSLGGDGFDQCNAIVALADGSTVLAGESRSTNGDVSGHHGDGSFSDAWIVKLDVAGALVWQRSLGGADYDVANAIAATTDGGVVIAGASNSDDGDVHGHHGSSDFSDGWVVRLSPAGEVLWQRSLGGSDNDEAYAVTTTRDGGVVVAGMSSSADGDISAQRGGDDLWVAKLDTEGRVQWSRTAGGSSNDGAYGVVELADGRIVAAGYSFSMDGDVRDHRTTPLSGDVWLATFDATGALVATHSYGGSRDDRAYAVIAVDSGVVFAGTSESSDSDVIGHSGVAIKRGWIAGVDTHGVLQWQQSLGGSQRDGLAALVATGDGLVAAGTAHGFGNGRHGDDDFWIVRFHPATRHSAQMR